MLDKRLKSVLSLIDCETLADVGCDHGKLTVEAIATKRAKRVLAIDISEKSLKKAQILVEEKGMSDNIDFFVSDGFDKVDIPYDTAVIAGMGGYEIIKILKNRKTFSSLILVAHQDAKALREYLNGKYKIEKDFVVLSGGKFYNIIKAVEGKTIYTESELYFGFSDKTNEDYNKYIAFEEKRINKVLAIANNLEMAKMAEIIKEMKIKIKDIINVIEDFAPIELSGDFDNCGLAYGEVENEVKGILITLDTTPEVVAEAKEKGCNLIIEHHPIIFDAIRNFDLRKPTHKALTDAIKSDIAIYSAHTNVDFTKGGLNDYLMEKLGLKEIELVSNESGARIGRLEQSTTLKEFSQRVKELLKDNNVATIGDLNKRIEKVSAINGGGGSSTEVIFETIDKKADVFLTADVKYKVARLSKDLDYAIISYGHYTSEIFFMELIEKLIKDHLDVHILKSEKCVNPYN